MKQTIVLYPAPGIGHIISMVELGKLLLLHHSHNFSITILLTTGMLDKPDIDSYLRRISHSYPSISFRRFPLLSLKPAASPRSGAAAAFEFIRLNSTNVASALTDIISQKFEIRALVIDIFCTSAMDIASSLGIPVYYFFTSGAAVLSAFLYFPKIHEQTTQSFKDLSIDLNFPANPPLKAFHMVEPSLDRDDPAYWDFLYFCSHLPKSKGIMVNTFQDLEPKAVKSISEGICFPDPKQAPPVYYIGPLIAEPKDQKEDVEDSGRIQNCLTWLEKQPSRSVVFLCFGSRGSMSAEQLKEIANGLEQSEVRFLWVVKRPPEDERTKQTEDTTVNFDLESVLPGGFMERTRDRGMVVRSWAPQVEVLATESVGGFVTHCGWNSVLEAVVAGVPMIAWPLHAEQHMNRNLMVEEMKIAVGLEHRDEDGFVKGDEFEKKVRELMESEKGKEMKERTLKMRILAESARGSLGSSTRALSTLVETWDKGN